MAGNHAKQISCIPNFILRNMKALKLLVIYQFSLCFSTLIETDNLSSDYQLYDDDALGNPQGILAKGLSDPGNLDTYYSSIFYDSGDTNNNQLTDMLDNSNDILPIQQKRLDAYSVVHNEVEEKQQAIPDRTSFNAVRSYGLIFGRPYRPSVTVEVKTENNLDEAGLSFITSVPLRPNLEIVDVIFSAALQQYLRSPTQSNPFNVVLDYDPNKDCDIIVSALNIPNAGIHTWKVKVTRRKGRVIYNNQCVTTSRRIRLRHGMAITVYYS